MTRRLLLVLPLLEQQIDSCELEAVARWNKFVVTSNRYLSLRQQGVRNVKERERMVREFADAIRHECF